METLEEFMKRHQATEEKSSSFEAFPKHWTIQFNARRTLFT